MQVQELLQQLALYYRVSLIYNFITATHFIDYFLCLFLDGGTGDCSTDQFSITSPGAWGSPVICGTNTGQHSKITL